jgi:DeoR family suf operon transcriptional repressor
MPNALSPILTSPPSTRRAILLVVKTRGEARVEEVADAVGVTASAARQHLAALEREGLVEHRAARESLGRPKHVYTLTEQASALFPQGYGELATELLAYVEEEDPELVERAFERRRARRVERARLRLAGKTFAERVETVAAMLDEEGFLAHFERCPGGAFRIAEHNCAILDVARRVDHACTSELGFLEEALPDAEIRRVAHMVAGAHVCAYEIRER